MDEQNAVAVREASVEKARIEGERGRRLLATQKVTAAAGNIRINVGSPLVIEAETRANIEKLRFFFRIPLLVSESVTASISDPRGMSTDLDPS